MIAGVVEKLLGTWFLNQVKQQGFSIILLVAASAIFFYQLQDIRHDYRNCNNQIIEILQTVVEKNTVAVEKNTVALEQVNEKLTCK